MHQIKYYVHTIHGYVVTKSMADTKKQLIEHPDHGVPNSLCSIFLKGFCNLEKALTSVSQLQFEMAKDLDTTKKISLKNNTVIDQNRAGGNIVSSVEKSSSYEKVCSEIKTTANYCKVLNIDFETELKTHPDIVKKARDVLSQTDCIKDQINSVQIVPLGNTTKLYDGKNVHGFTDEHVKEMMEEEPDEGILLGISARFIQNQFSNAIVNPRMGSKSINPFMLLLARKFKYFTDFQITST